MWVHCTSHSSRWRKKTQAKEVCIFLLALQTNQWNSEQYFMDISLHLFNLKRNSWGLLGPQRDEIVIFFKTHCMLMLIFSVLVDDSLPFYCL